MDAAAEFDRLTRNRWVTLEKTRRPAWLTEGGVSPFGPGGKTVGKGKGGAGGQLGKGPSGAERKRAADYHPKTHHTPEEFEAAERSIKHYGEKSRTASGKEKWDAVKQHQGWIKHLGSKKSPFAS